MRILLTGSSGQLGKAIISRKPNNVDLIEINREKLDLENEQQCEEIILRYRPDLLINCAAYTDVDKAEKEPKLAKSINSVAPKILSESLLKIGGKLIQISTDYVFNGQTNIAYDENSLRNPVNIYGSTKVGAEEAIQKIFNDSGDATIIRTSWLIGSYGNNFVDTMLELNEIKDEIRVVSDQIGSPTSIFSLSNVCWKIVDKFLINNSGAKLPSILHWSDAGIASWYDLAISIADIALELGLIKKKARILPIYTNEYPRAAKRPPYSLLDSSKARKLLNISSTHWRHMLVEILQKIKSSRNSTKLK
ncbi:dTDP-4-dehydrorhamnose reductase [Prochlorococcus sp. MIT 1011]|uniref:dTDP-4-dehydrorhamnose reductase n=1 Tax=Prochlorococcus sp. MIT 1011 TaxID=3082520 RepID=UPI0039B5B78E